VPLFRPVSWLAWTWSGFRTPTESFLPHTFDGKRRACSPFFLASVHAGIFISFHSTDLFIHLYFFFCFSPEAVGQFCSGPPIDRLVWLRVSPFRFCLGAGRFFSVTHTWGFFFPNFFCFHLKKGRFLGNPGFGSTPSQTTLSFSFLVGKVPPGSGPVEIFAFFSNPTPCFRLFYTPSPVSFSGTFFSSFFFPLFCSPETVLPGVCNIFSGTEPGRAPAGFCLLKLTLPCGLLNPGPAAPFLFLKRPLPKPMCKELRIGGLAFFPLVVPFHSRSSTEML